MCEIGFLINLGSLVEANCWAIYFNSYYGKCGLLYDCKNIHNKIQVQLLTTWCHSSFVNYSFTKYTDHFSTGFAMGCLKCNLWATIFQLRCSKSKQAVVDEQFAVSAQNGEDVAVSMIGILNWTFWEMKGTWSRMQPYAALAARSFVLFPLSSPLFTTALSHPSLIARALFYTQLVLKGSRCGTLYFLVG